MQVAESFTSTAEPPLGVRAAAVECAEPVRQRQSSDGLPSRRRHALATGDIPSSRTLRKEPVAWGLAASGGVPRAAPQPAPTGSSGQPSGSSIGPGRRRGGPSAARSGKGVADLEAKRRKLMPPCHGGFWPDPQGSAVENLVTLNSITNADADTFVSRDESFPAKSPCAGGVRASLHTRRGPPLPKRQDSG